MAAAKGNKNAAGKHRVTDINDKQLAAEVRSLALNEIKEILELPRMTQLKQQVILRLAGSVLPRLNEHAGSDDPNAKPIPIQLVDFTTITFPNTYTTSSSARVVGD